MHAVIDAASPDSGRGLLNTHSNGGQGGARGESMVLCRGATGPCEGRGGGHGATGGARGPMGVMGGSWGRCQGVARSYRGAQGPIGVLGGS